MIDCLPPLFYPTPILQIQKCMFKYRYKFWSPNAEFEENKNAKKRILLEVLLGYKLRSISACKQLPAVYQKMSVVFITSMLKLDSGLTE